MSSMVQEGVPRDEMHQHALLANRIRRAATGTVGLSVYMASSYEKRNVVMVSSVAVSDDESDSHKIATLSRTVRLLMMIPGSRMIIVSVKIHPQP